MPENVVKTFPCPRHSQMARQERQYGWTPRACSYCTDGQVTVDVMAIFKAIAPLNKATGKHELRRSRPKVAGYDQKPGKSPVYGAAYVWRMIRFHSGADLHLPVMAGDYVGLGWVTTDNDKPLAQFLDLVTELIGERLYGQSRMLRASAAWGSALGFEGADDLKATLSRTVGMPLGNGNDIGGVDASPEAALDAATDEDGNVDFDALLKT